jgi:hypothetical protein
MPFLGKLHGERESLRLPGLGKYRAAFVPRKTRQSG